MPDVTGTLTEAEYTLFRRAAKYWGLDTATAVHHILVTFARSAGKVSLRELEANSVRSPAKMDLGFKKLQAAALPLLGAALRTEFGPWAGLSMQAFEYGLAVWDKDGGITFVQNETGRIWLFDEANNRVTEIA